MRIGLGGGDLPVQPCRFLLVIPTIWVHRLKQACGRFSGRPPRGRGPRWAEQRTAPACYVTCFRTAQVANARSVFTAPAFFVFVPVLVVLIVLVVVPIIVVVVLLVLFFLLVFILIVRLCPALGLVRLLEIHLMPGLEVDLLDLAVEILDLDQLRVFIHRENTERLFVFQVLVPLSGNRLVISAHRIASSGLAAASLAYSFPMTIPRPPSSSPLARARRIVVKVGSALLTDSETGRINRAWLESLVEDLLRLRKRGQQVILVSSGAIALGRRQLGLAKGPLRLEESQAAAAVGQIRLAHAYKELLEGRDVTVAQVLLTLEDSERRRRYLNARATLETLLSLGA